MECIIGYASYLNQSKAVSSSLETKLQQSLLRKTYHVVDKVGYYMAHTYMCDIVCVANYVLVLIPYMQNLHTHNAVHMHHIMERNLLEFCSENWLLVAIC